MSEPRPGGPRRPVVLWVAAAVVLFTAGLLVVLFGQRSLGPGPPPSPGGSSGPATTETLPPTGTTRPVPPLSRSAPVRLRIPAIGVDAPVTGMGLNPDGTAGEPPLSQPYLVSWFKDGAAPGESGPAAFYGHVDSARSGPAVFYRVGALRPGAVVEVTRQDGLVATFRLYAVERFPKAAFPTDRVYGDVGRPEIRLVTCGGAFDQATRSYRDNVVAFGALTGSSPRSVAP